MNQRQVLQPNENHPISIEPTKGRVVVIVAGKKVAESTRALSVREAKYPVVHYIPHADVDHTLIVKSDHSTWCPYKGEASYHTIPHGGERSENAIWTYEAPHDAVAAIKDHVAFYPDRVDSIEIVAE
ncbi:MAG TPA: DUF427 domain-containing protein [Candidatus Tumulicola sp.]